MYGTSFRRIVIEDTDVYIQCSEKQIFIFNVFNFHGSVHLKNIHIYIQQDATLHSVFYLETALHVSGVTTSHHQKRKQLYLQHLVFVTPLLLPAAVAIS